jgi:transglutaminase-like putative cysteine protease
MRIALLHRRLTILMAISGLVAFAAGAGFEPISALLAFITLMVAFFWQPSPRLSVRLEPAWLPVAVLLVARALWHVFIVQDDVVIPVVDLLLLLMCAETLRSLDAPNDTRLYALSFSLLVASTAYRPGIFFAIAFVAYVTMATVALTIGHLRRKAQRHRTPEPPVDRALVSATAGLGTVVLVTSMLVFLAFPRVTRGFAGRGDVPVTEVAGFSDQVSIGEFGSQIYSNPQIVLRVEFPGGAPVDVNNLRWRGRSYDRFDGLQWSHSGRLPPSQAPRTWYRERWTGPVVEQRIFAAPLEAKVLFAMHPALRLDSDRRTAPVFDNGGDLLYYGTAAPTYTAWSMTALPPAEELRAADEEAFSPSSRFYLQLPQRLPDRIYELADSLTAGLDNRYDKAVAIERYLRTFAYTLELPATARQATLDYFLFERQAGHCEYFSTAMVVLLRAAGVHSREVNGFRGGQWSEFGEYLAVTQNQAHSWVEVWIPEFGWVPFDPTPAGAGGTVATIWFWPGRFLFDGLQHRWNKWVLDYSSDNQYSMLDRLQGIGEPETVSAENGGPPFAGFPWALAAVGLGMAGLLWGLLRGGRAQPAETRAYLRLLELCRRAGLIGPNAVGPLELVESLEARAHPAAGAARSLVELYLRARFGGQALDERERRALGEALGRARTHLRPA